MPIYEVQGPDGRIYEVEGPEGASEQQVIRFLQQQLASQPAPPQPQEGIVAALRGGAERFVSTGRTAFGALSDAEAAAQAGLARSQDISERFAPATSLERVKQAYRERGLLPAAGEVISQIPGALAEQAPQIAATLGGAKAGAIAGAPLGPKGVIAGGITGAVAPSLMQLFGANIERQAAEQQEAGQPIDIDRGAAAAAAVPAAGLEVAATFIPFGRTLIGKILGPNAERALGTPAGREMVNQGLTRTVLQGGAVGLGAEVPTEVIQQMLERAQAGLDLTSDDALAEYGEAAYGAALVGGPLGAAGRIYQRSAQRTEQAEAEEARVAAEEAALNQLAIDAERESATADVPFVRTAQEALPGFAQVEPQETAAEVTPVPVLREERTRLQQLLEMNQEELSAANAAQDFDRTEQLITQREAIQKRLEAAETDLKAQGFEDRTEQIADMQSQLQKIENQLAKQSGPGTDPAKVQRLVGQRRDLRSRLDIALEEQGALGQRALDLGAPRALADPFVEGERFGAQQAQQELQSRQQLMQAQQVSPEAQPDLFAESMEQVETQRREGETNFDYLDDIFEQAFDQDRPAVAPPEGVQASQRSQSLLGRLEALDNQIEQTQDPEERQRLEGQRAILAGTSDADPNLRAVYSLRNQSENALLELEGAIDDLRTGTFFVDGQDVGTASTTRQGLNRRAEEAKRAYIRGVLQEAAALRRIRNEPGLTTDEALQAADRINTELDELINRSQAVREVEEVVTQPAQMRGTEIVSPARTAMRDVRPLAERPFGKYRAALGTILDGIEQTRQSLTATQPLRVEQPLLRTQFAETEAQRVAEERGETATTLGGELRRRTEFVRNKMARMGTMRPQARDVLNRAADLMDEGRVTRDLLAAVEQVVDTVNRGQMPLARDLRAVTDVMAAMQETPAGQRELFDTPADRKRREEEIGYIRATPENFEKSPLIRKAREAVEGARRAEQAFRKFLTDTQQRRAQEKVAKEEQRAAKVEKLKNQLAEQRADLEAALVSAQDEVAAQRQAARTLMAEPRLKEAQKRIDTAQDALTKQLQRQALFEEGEADSVQRAISNRIKKAQKELNEAQAALDTIMVEVNTELDAALVAQEAAQDSNVKFEQAVLDKIEKQLAKLIGEQGAQQEVARVNKAAEEQRARVARVEKAQRDAAEKASKERESFKERLARGLDLPSFRSRGFGNKTKLEEDARALQAVIDNPSAKVLEIQARIKAENARPAPTNKKDRDNKRKRLKYANDQLKEEAAKHKEVVETAKKNLRELNAQMGSYKALTDVQRAQDKAATEAMRARAVQFDPLEFIGVPRPPRATGPAAKAQSAAPAQMRTGTPESRAGESRTSADQRVTESRRPKERDVAIKTSEMQEANTLAELIRNKTPAQKRREAAEAAAVERELRKAQESYSEGDFDALESAVRDTVYESRPTFDLRPATAEMVRDGRVLDALESLEKVGSTDTVKQLAARLRPLMMRTKLRVADNLTNSKGVPVEGLYVPETNTVVLDSNGLNEESLLHELTHAATLNALRADTASLTPEQRQAVQDLRSLFEQAQNDAAFSKEYAIKNLEEFVAELMSNQKVRDKLDAMKPANQPSLLQRIYDAIMRVFGAKGLPTSEKAMADAYAIFAPSKPSQGAVVASVMRGVFPNHDPEFNAKAPASFRAGLTPTAAETKRNDKLSAFMLGLRTKVADQWAAREALLKAGLSGKKLTEEAVTQSRIYMRLNSEANRFAHQAMLDAPLALVKDEKGYFGVSVDEKRPGYARVLETLRSVVGEVGNMEATEAVFQKMLQIERAETDGVGYDKINTRKPPTAAEVRQFKADISARPKLKAAFDKAREQYRDYNNGMLDFVKAAGVFTDAEIAQFKKGNYVPFYRLNEATGNVEMSVGNSTPRTIGNIINQPQLKELVGGEKAFLGLSESVLQNTQMLTRMALQNLQARDVGFMLQKMGLGKIATGEGPANTIRFKLNGEPRWIKLETDLFPPDIPAETLLQGLHGVKAAVPLALQMAGIPTRVLRATIVRMPLYIIRQMIRDPLHAWFTTGQKFTPVVDSIKEMTKMYQGKSENEAKLMRSGAISSNVMAGDYTDAARTLRDLTAEGKPWNQVMQALDNAALRADASTRAVLYAKYRQQGMSHFEAALGAAEVMNFQRRGTSSSLYMMSTLVPFFNAQIQGLDSIYRGVKADTVFEKRLDVRNKLTQRAALMVGLTLAYTLAMQDDEAYENATPQERAMNWFLPIPGVEAALRVPIPFEIGILTKAIPELLFNAGFGDTSSGDTVKGLKFALGMSVPTVIPTAAQPLIELATNYSFFRDGPIETTRDKAVAPELRYRETTTELAKTMGQVTGLSPLQIEHFVRGYTSTAGVLAMSMFNPILRPFTSEDRGEKVDKLISQTPFFGAAFQPNTGRGLIDSVYADVEDWQQAAATFKRLVEEGRTAEARAYADNKSREIALSATGGSFRQMMGELAKMRRAIEANPEMSGAEKRERLDALQRYQITLAGKIRELAKASE